MILFYVTASLLVIAIGYSIYENKRNNLRRMIYDKQNEFGNTEIKVIDRTCGKYGVAFTMVTTLLFTPSMFQSSSIYEYDEDMFQMIEVSAGEYLINAYGEGFSFGVNLFVDNNTIELLDEQYPYYEGFNRYHTVNELVDLETFYLDEVMYAMITINNSYKSYVCLEVDEYDMRLKWIDFDFYNFKEDITVLHELMGKYPPVLVEKKWGDGSSYIIEKINPDYIEIENDYYRSLYKKYFETTSSSSHDETPAEMRRVELNYYAEGSLANMGEVIKLGSSFYGIDKVTSQEQIDDMQHNDVFSRNPFWTVNDTGLTALGIYYRDVYSNIEDLVGYAYLNDIKTENESDIYSTIFVDIERFGDNPSIEVVGDITTSLVRKTETENGLLVENVYSKIIELNEYYIIDHFLVIPPRKLITVYRDGINDVNVDYEFVIKINDEEVIVRHSSGFNILWRN